MSACLRSRAVRRGLAVAVAGAALLPLAPADAAMVAPLTFAGTGTASPGIPATGAAAVSYQMTGVMNGATVIGEYPVVVNNAPCSFSGSSSVAESVAAGGGSGTLVCEAPSGQVGKDASRGWSWHLHCYVVWTRVDWTWRFSLRCYWVVDWYGRVMATADTAAEAVMKGEPTSLNPITSYALAGAVAAVG